MGSGLPYAKDPFLDSRRPQSEYWGEGSLQRNSRGLKYDKQRRRHPLPEAAQVSFPIFRGDSRLPRKTGGAEVSEMIKVKNESVSVAI